MQAIGRSIVGLGQRAGQTLRSFGRTIKRTVSRIKQTAQNIIEDIIGEKNIPPNVRFWARFADDAYYKDRRSDKDGFIYQPSMSELRKAVWKKSSRGNAGAKYVIAYRGTSLIDPEDYVADAYIVAAMEQEMPRIHPAVQEVESLLSQGNEVVMTGHSLGGGVAMEVLQQLSPGLVQNATAYAYDPGFAKIMITQSPNWQRHLYIYRTAGDPISVSARSVDAKENRTFQKKDPTMLAHRLEQLL